MTTNQADSNRVTREAYFICVVFFLLSILLLIASPLDLAPDEAHYWEWSRRLDLAYYSKGPLIAYAIRASCSIFGDTPFGVRFPAALSQLLFSLGFVRFVGTKLNRTSTTVLTLALLSSPIFFYQRLIMTTDPLVSLFWLSSILLLGNVVTRPTFSRAILWGATIGGAFLSKYTAAALFAALPAPFFTLEGSPRSSRSLGLQLIFVSLLTSLFFLAPVLLWNSTHDWVNFSHNAQHVSSSSRGLRPEKFLELVGGQIIFAGPWLLAFACSSMFQAVRMIKLSELRALKTPDVTFWIALPGSALAAICVLTSFTRTVYANWPMPVYISGILCGALLLANQSTPSSFDQNSFLQRNAHRGIAFSIFQCVIASALFCGVTFGIPPDVIQTKKLSGWQFLGSEIDSSNSQSLPVITENYDVASEIAFYARSAPQVLTAVVDGRRMNQYDIWGGWEALSGKDVLIVSKNRNTIDILAPHFRQVTPVKTISIEWEGKIIRTFELWVGRYYDGFRPKPPLKR